MESISPRSSAVSRKNLENYAVSYMGAYMNTVKKERPEHLPVVARCQPCETVVVNLPNSCFCMLFEKAEKEKILVTDMTWSELESKARSGVTHLVAVYAHEGVTVADAIARGKKDAIRDIRSLEDSDIAKAVSQLEKILDGIKGVESGNRGTVKFGELELAKLQPVKEALKNAGPEVDMLGVIDALKNYPSAPVAVRIDIKEKELLENLARELGDLSDVIRRVETQDRKVEEIQKSLNKVLSELNRNIDERIGKGLAVILSSSDKKIDKGLAALSTAARKDVGTGMPKDLEMRLERLEKAAQMAEMLTASYQKPVEPPREVMARIEMLEQVLAKLNSYVASTLEKPPELPKDLETRLNRLEQVVDKVETEILTRPDVSSELVRAVTELRDISTRLGVRLTKIEECLIQLQSAAAQRQRVLKQPANASKSP